MIDREYCVLIASIIAVAAPVRAEQLFINYSNGNTVYCLALQDDNVLWAGTLGGGVIRWDLQSGAHVKYTATDGLVYNTVQSVAVDSSGNLWCGTLGFGVSRFDGRNWTSFKQESGLFDKQVTAIGQDFKGRMWFGTYNDYAKCYDGSDWSSVSRQDGLSDNNIHDIERDGKGGLWFATSRGVSRLDSSGWTTITTRDGLANRAVAEIYSDRDGILWFASMADNYGKEAVSRYDGVTWTTFADTLLNARHQRSMLVDSRGDIWLGTDKGLLRYHQGAWGMVKPQQSGFEDVVSDMVEDSRGRVYFATTGAGIAVFDGAVWTRLQLENEYSGQTGGKLTLDHKGDLWCVTASSRPYAGRICRFDGKEWHGYPVPQENGINDVAGSIAVDRQGIVWLGSTGEGLVSFDGLKWTRYDTLDGLPSNYIYALALNSTGRLWAGTIKGAVRFDDTRWTTYTNKDSLADDWVIAFHPDGQERMICGTQRGVSLFDGIKWSTLPDRNFSSTTYDIADAVIRDRQGNIWMSLRKDGAARWDGNGWTTFNTRNSAIASDWSTCFTLDSLGFLWCGTINGLCRFNGRQWRSFDMSDGLPDIYITDLLTDRQGNIWIITSYGGLSCLTAEAIATFQEPPVYNPDIELKFYDKVDGLVSNSVLCVAVDKQGNKWFGANDGISRFDGSVWTTFRPDSSIRKDNYCRDIAVDTDGSIWFTSINSGVRRYDGSRWSTFTTADGLISNTVNHIFIDAKGVKWFGTYQGVSRFDGTEWKSYTKTDGLLDNMVNALTVDNYGTAWFAVSGGVSCFDGSNWKSFDYTNSPLQNYVWNIRCDHRNNIWLATWGKGLFKYDGQDWTVIDSIAGLVGNNAREVYFDNRGDMWVAVNGKGVSRFDGVRWTNYSVNDGLASNYVDDIVQDSNGDYWLACGGAVNALRFKNQKPQNDVDVNADGRKDVFDLLLLLRVLSGAEHDSAITGKADVNSDGRVDVFDLLALLKALSGW